MAAVSFTFVFLILSIFLIMLHVFHKMAKKLNQPLVLSEIILGFLLGPSFLALMTLDEKNPFTSLSFVIDVSSAELSILITVFLFLVQLAEIFLLFEVGLEIEFDALKKAGKGSVFTAFGGMILPFLSGLLLIFLLTGWYESLILPLGFSALDVGLFFAATLTATSIGISIRTFMDLDKVDSSAARIMIGAAVIDDILALSLLTVVISLLEEEAAAGTSAVEQVFVIFISMVAFFVLAIVLAQLIFPKFIMPYLEREKEKNLPLIFGLAFLFLMAWLAEMLYLAPIIGAVVAGIILRTNEDYANRILEQISPLAHWVVPLFFISVGLRVNLWKVITLDVIIIASLVILVAVFSKLIGSGMMARISGAADIKDSFVIGVSMAARGEVVLVFAAVALDLGIFTVSLYSSVVLLVVITAILVPTVLKYSFRLFDSMRARELMESTSRLNKKTTD